ncbi:MAG: type II secretion system F family protein [Deferribacterales bacterium]
MDLYRVRILESTGNIVKKNIEVEPGEDITAYLTNMGVNVVGVAKVSPLSRIFKPRKKIKTQEVIETIDNLHMIVKSGMPITTALGDLAEDADNPAMGDILSDISSRLQMGMTFSKAISKYTNVFTDVVVNLVHIGEETGQLDNTLKSAAQHLKKMSDLKSKTKSALIYPSFAFVAMMAVMIFWLVVVMPKMIEAFQSFNITLPPTTRFVMWLSAFMQSYILYMIAGGIALLVINSALRKNVEKYRYSTDMLILKTPIIGLVTSNFNFAFIAEYTRLMISAGLPLYTALSIMEESMTNVVYKKSIFNTRDLISSGTSFSQALSEQNLYPKLVTRMIGIGEQTGNLDGQLGNVAEHYYYKVDMLATNMSKMIEPVVIGVIGVFMLVIMIGLMGPIFTLISSMPT